MTEDERLVWNLLKSPKLGEFLRELDNAADGAEQEYMKNLMLGIKEVFIRVIKERGSDA